MPKNYHTIALISPSSKRRLKILQGRLQLYVNLQMFKIDLEKLEEPEIKLPTSLGSWKKQESSSKTSTSALLTMPKPLTVWITTNCGKFKRWKYQTTSPASWEICMQVKKQQLELDKEHPTRSKSGNCTSRLYLSPCLFNLYVEYTYAGWMKHKLESRLPGEISITSDMQMIPHLWQKVKN